LRAFQGAKAKWITPRGLRQKPERLDSLCNGFQLTPGFCRPSGLKLVMKYNHSIFEGELSEQLATIIIFASR
jgi:hypothetical protein